MAKKTNKTSHVLNLITGGTTEPESESQQESSSAPQPAAQKPALAQPQEQPPQEQKKQPQEQKIVVVESGKDEKIAEDIRRQLLSEVGETEPALEDAKAVEEPEPPEENSVQAEQAEPVEPAEPEPEEVTERETYCMVNVMEEILSPEFVRSEMEKYGVCLCSRCQADVKALLLTRLQPKYVVVNKEAVPPLLSYYKNKYRVSLLANIIKTCMDVREHPRHDGK